ncbi:MAG: undecaprenyl/decaprenyl-phosphate alpha-N-acetylglucosaminyl 1-phosphate transferase [Defluviitaleaceae bacterium]|nr:undecaprenyl/decaprenyl-phosphate alpha-N-acetylglucosaminyl 1-phosphate transferase [Defluviitaleaceae bacterium]
MEQHNWLLYIAAFASAFGIALFTTPFAKKISIKLGAIDYPKKRGLHTKPLPRMGGLAIFSGFIVTIFVIMPFQQEFRDRQFIGFLIGAIIIAALGALDDVRNSKGGLSAKIRLAVQILAALIVVLTGTRIDVSMWPMGEHLSVLSAPITIIWIVGLINAVNLIDGVDGLAAGVSSICALCLMVLCIITGSPLAVVLAATLAGSCLGFLPRNFNPAELIMGDTGATFLGYVLAVSSILGVFKSYTILVVIVAVLSMALPILDTLFAMIRRAYNGKHIMTADRGHLHHRLIDRGYSQKQAVAILYGISLLTGIFSIAIAIRNFFALMILGVFFLALLCVLYVYKKRTTKDTNEAKE